MARAALSGQEPEDFTVIPDVGAEIARCDRIPFGRGCTIEIDVPGGHARVRIVTAPLPACLLALGLAAAPVSADIDIEVQNGDRVTGTILPADEMEVLRADLPKDAVLKVTAKGKKQRGQPPPPVVGLEVLDDKDQNVAAGLVTPTGKGAKIKQLTIKESGEYRICVTGDGANVGNYQVKLKWKTRKKTSEEIDVTGGGAVMMFSADAGATVDFTAKASKGSSAVPRLSQVAHPATGFKRQLNLPTAKDTFKKLTVPSFGDYVLTVANDGADGNAIATAKVKSPKPAKRKITLTDALIGSGGGADDALGKLLGTEGGNFTIDDLGPTSIAGASIDVPPGSLPGDTLIVIATAPPLEDPPSPGQEGVGPTVFFGPPGTEFNPAATVTIPFDPGPFLGDFGDLRVSKSDAEGNLTVVDPGTYDLSDAANGLVSFPVTSFSRFRGFGPPAGPPRPGKGDLNADGKEDLVVPSLGEDAVYVFFSSQALVSPVDAADADAIISGPQGLGTTFAKGDVNGDQIDDLILGAPAAFGGDGAVWVFFGGENFPTGDLDPNDDADVTISGQQGENLGACVAVGDVLQPPVGTPSAEVIAGAPLSGIGGAAYVFQGPLLASTNSASADVTIAAGAAGDSAGFKVAAGPVDADGIDDVIVGATQMLSAQGGGIVGVFPGGPNLADISFESAPIVLSAESQGDQFGARICVADVTGEGQCDVIVGAINANQGIGRVYMFLGGADLRTRGAVDANVMLNGLVDNKGFVDSLACGDLNGDQIDDIIVSAPADGPPGLEAGAAFIFNGGPTLATTDTSKASFKIMGSGENTLFGDHVSVQDVDGNGALDLVATAPLFSGVVPLGGAASIFNGGVGFAPPAVADQADVTIVGDQNQEFGQQ